MTTTTSQSTSGISSQSSIDSKIQSICDIMRRSNAASAMLPARCSIYLS